MAEERYNGWANRATWNVALWLGNDEPSYRAAVAFARKASLKGIRGRLGAASAEYFVKQCLGWDRTPDGVGLSPVRWGEIANCIREMAE